MLCQLVAMFMIDNLTKAWYRHVSPYNTALNHFVCIGETVPFLSAKLLLDFSVLCINLHLLISSKFEFSISEYHCCCIYTYL